MKRTAIIKIKAFLIAIIFFTSCKMEQSDYNNWDTIDFGTYIYTGHIDTSVDRENYRYDDSLYRNLCKKFQYKEACQYARQYTLKDSNKQAKLDSNLNVLEKTGNKLVKYYNDSIQDIIFESHMGDAREMVLEKLNKHGLYADKRYSTDYLVYFFPKSRFFSFGNMNWEYITAKFSNNKLFCIEFIITNDNKSEATKRYEYVFKQCQQKYNIAQDNSSDESVINCAVGYAPNGKSISIFCVSYFPIDSKNMRYRTILRYEDDSFSVSSNEI